LSVWFGGYDFMRKMYTREFIQRRGIRHSIRALALTMTIRRLKAEDLVDDPHRQKARKGKDCFGSLAVPAGFALLSHRARVDDNRGRELTSYSCKID